VLFVGSHDLTIDAKGRLAVPSEIRSQLDPSGSPQVLYAAIQVLTEGPTLSLYTEQGFARRAEQLENSPRPAEEVLEYEQMFYGLACRVEMDKQGRIRVPDNLVRIAQLDKDVVMIGVKDHLQIHDRDAWLKKVADTLANRPQMLMNPRRIVAPASAASGTSTSV
jgi:MraZ protein